MEINRERYLRYNEGRLDGGAPWSLVTRMRMEANLLSEKARGYLKDFSRKLQEYVGQAIDRAQARGELAADAPAQDMATQGRRNGERGAFMVLSHDEGRDFWQPVPANGHVSVRVAPGMVEMEHPLGLGTQTLPPGGHVREHAHDRNEEVLHFIFGTGKAVVDGVEHPVGPGTTIFVGRNRRHKFVNDGEGELHWLWLIVPNGLEDFFEQIGRPKAAGEAAPENFARPADVLEVERRTGFAAPVAGG